MKLKHLIFIILSSFFLKIQAQDFGAYPPSLKWEQINTDTLRIIFPSELEPQAQRTSALIHYMAGNNKNSIGDMHWKLNLVMRNQTVVSNGYVGLAPFRSEYYTTAPQQSDMVGSLPWTDQLTIHEYRHAEQFMNTPRGINRLAYYCLGENVLGGLAMVSVPSWYWEGDAVANETALSAQGRGRIPSFTVGFRALELKGIRYSYAKIRNSSYRDYVPNHYKSGYLMCAYGRNKYDNNLWKRVFIQTMHHRGIIYPFSSSLKRETKLSTRTFYNEALNNYGNQWRNEVVELKLTPSTVYAYTNKKSVYTDYTFPVVMEDGKVLCRTESFDHTAHFQIIDSLGKKTSIVHQGASTDDNFSYRNGIICWTNTSSDIRWNGLTYSDITLYNLSTKETRTITHKEKYFSPDLSPDCKTLVVSKITPNMQSKLLIIDATTGTAVKEMPNNNNWVYTFPVFSSDGLFIYSAIRDNVGKMALAKISIQNNETKILTPFSYHIIGKPVVTQNKIFFTASYSGIDNVYMVNESNSDVYQVTSVATGTATPAFDEKNNLLIYPEYTTKGYELKKTTIQPSNLKKINIVEPLEMPNYTTAYAKQECGNILDSTYTNNIKVVDYPLFSNLINIHSYRPVSTVGALGLMVNSENILNTLQINASALYNRNEERPEFIGEMLFGQYYPIFRLGASASESVEYMGSNTSNFNFHKLDQRIEAGVKLPLDFSHGNYSTKLITSLSYAHVFYTESDYIAGIKDLTYKAKFPGIVSSFSLSNQQYAAKQNIYSPLGQTLTVSYNRSVNVLTANQFDARGEFTFRGIFPNHNIRFITEYKKENAQNKYRYSDNFGYARGYNVSDIYPYFNDSYILSAEYHFPLFYPDLGFAGIFYISRIRMDLFADCSNAEVLSQTFDGSLYTFNQKMNSIGTEMIFDIKWLSLINVSLGLRYSHTLNNVSSGFNTSKFEVFIPVISY
jgi:hypothetical protein